MGTLSPPPLPSLSFRELHPLPPSVDLHPSKALFSLDSDNLQLHCFLGSGVLFCCSFLFVFSTNHLTRCKWHRSPPRPFSFPVCLLGDLPLPLPLCLFRGLPPLPPLLFSYHTGTADTLQYRHQLWCLLDMGLVCESDRSHGLRILPHHTGSEIRIDAPIKWLNGFVFCCSLVVVVVFRRNIQFALQLINELNGTA